MVIVALKCSYLQRWNLYYWRLAGTAFSFVLFGLGGLVLGLLLLPGLRLIPGGAGADGARARAVIRGALRFFIAFMHGVGVLTWEFRGVERLGRPGQLIVANHPSLIDVVFLLGFTPGAQCVVKKELWGNPLTRHAVAAAGYVNNSPTEEMVMGAAARLDHGDSLIMFPEGTRTRPGEPMHFHRGAANVAVRAAKVVTPVFIGVEPSTLTKSEPWYHIPNRRPHFSLRVGEDIDPQPYRVRASIPLASRALNARLLEIFAAELKRPA